jgi:hypothetical protein
VDLSFQWNPTGKAPPYHLVSNRLKHVNGVSLRDFKEKTINQPSTGMIEERPEGDLDGISNKSIIKQ